MTKRSRFTAADEQHVRYLFGRIDSSKLAKQVGCSLESLQRKARTVFERVFGAWSPAHDEALLERLGKASLADVAVSLGRTETEVKVRLDQLRAAPPRRHALPESDVIAFRRRYGRLTDEDAALVFGLPLETVKRLATQYRLAKDKAFLVQFDIGTKMPRWKAEEEARLRQMYGEASNLEIAQELQRSVKSVVSKAHQLGLAKSPSRLRQMGKENRALRAKR